MFRQLGPVLPPTPQIGGRGAGESGPRPPQLGPDPSFSCCAAPNDGGPGLGMGPATLCSFYGSRGNQPGDRRIVAVMARNNTSNVQRDRRLWDCALANAQIIQFAPYLARKQERLLARQLHHSRIVEGDIRAWVAALIEWSARY